MLRQARGNAGFTQEQLAKKMATKKSAISRIENHVEDIHYQSWENLPKPWVNP